MRLKSLAQDVLCLNLYSLMSLLSPFLVVIVIIRYIELCIFCNGSVNNPMFA